MLVKLGIRASPRTVSKYMPKRPRGNPVAIIAAVSAGI